MSILLGMYLFVLCSCQKTSISTPTIAAPFLEEEVLWIDSLLVNLSLEEKLGQLLYWSGDSVKHEQLATWIADGQIGGFQLPGLELDQYLHFTDSLREISDLPLFIGTDEPVALFNHFSDLAKFPKPLTVGSIQADSIARQLAALYAAQCEAVGINLVQAPQLGHYELKDTTYQFSFFSDDREKISERASLLNRFLLSRHILPIGQQINQVYPITTDSLSLVNNLAPYRDLTQQGVCGWSVSSNIFPIDTAGRGEGAILKNYLDKHLGFDGLIFTTVNDTTSLKTQLLSGSHLLKINRSPDQYVEAMKTWLERGEWSETDLNFRLEKIWKAKEWMNKSRDSLTYYDEIAQWLEHDHFELMSKELYHQALSIPSDSKCLLPLEKIHQQRFIILTVGESPLKVFPKYCKNYVGIRNQFFRNPDFPVFPTRALQRAKRSTVLFVLDRTRLDTVQHAGLIKTINELANKTKLLVLNFGDPKELRHFDPSITMIQLYERNDVTEALAAQAIFGGIDVNGKLPVRVASHMPRGKGVEKAGIRLGYGNPGAVGVEEYRLSGIDAIMQRAIRSKTMPGGQIFVVKSGQVIYDKSFGFHTYKKKQKVETSHLYDVASVTKVAATTLGVMRLYEQGRIRLQDQLKRHLPIDKKRKVGKITVEQLLSHRSGLRPNMPITKFISSKKRRRYWFDCNEYYCTSKGEEPYTLAIADSLYMDPRWVDSIWQKVYRMRVYRSKRVRYSDVNFNLLQNLIETKTKRPLDQYLHNMIYRPLHLRSTLYKPMGKFTKSQIVPTARDQMWRHQLVHGYVHDESAALLGGVGGNAGLFTNARDMGILFSMLLNGGSYGGKEFFKKETIETFTRSNKRKRRAYGFERKIRSRLRGCSNKASRQTYGHTGFTGSAVWVDPKHDLVFVFLANRVHPNPKNARIFNKKIRERVHSVVYDALDTYERAILPEWKETLPNASPAILPVTEAIRAGR